MTTTIWIMDNAPIHVSNEAKEKIREMEMQWLSICPYSPSLNPIEKFIGAIKSRCRSKFYNEGLKVNSNAIMKEAEGIHSKTIKECIIKSKIESVQQLQIYLNYSS